MADLRYESTALRKTRSPSASKARTLPISSSRSARLHCSRASTPVQETAIQTSNYAAEYGQAGGGLYNITMRSGTNQYHGGGFDYLANEAFNASFPYVNTKPRVRRNDYGFNFGGPATIPGLYKGRDKTFFF